MYDLNLNLDFYQSLQFMRYLIFLSLP